jgi:hypothetical protein
MTLAEPWPLLSLGNVTLKLSYFSLVTLRQRCSPGHGGGGGGGPNTIGHCGVGRYLHFIGK